MMSPALQRRDISIYMLTDCLHAAHRGTDKPTKLTNLAALRLRLTVRLRVGFTVRLSMGSAMRPRMGLGVGPRMGFEVTLWVRLRVRLRMGP